MCTMSPSNQLTEELIIVVRFRQGGAGEPLASRFSSDEPVLASWSMGGNIVSLSSLPHENDGLGRVER